MACLVIWLKFIIIGLVQYIICTLALYTCIVCGASRKSIKQKSTVELIIIIKKNVWSTVHYALLRSMNVSVESAQPYLSWEVINDWSRILWLSVWVVNKWRCTAHYNIALVLSA